MKKLLFLLAFLPTFCFGQDYYSTIADLRMQASGGPYTVYVSHGFTSTDSMGGHYDWCNDCGADDGFNVIRNSGWPSGWAWRRSYVYEVQSVVRSGDSIGLSTGGPKVMASTFKPSGTSTQIMGGGGGAMNFALMLPAIVLKNVGGQMSLMIKGPGSVDSVVSNSITLPTGISPAPVPVTRPINSTQFMPSASKYVLMSYSINIVINNLLGANSSGYVYLEEYNTTTSTWDEVCSAGQATNILSSPTQRSTLYGVAKPGVNYRIRSVATPGGLSTVNIAYQSGQETPL